MTSATRGDWNTVWSSFDKRQGAKAKAANEAGSADAAADAGPGLFDAGGSAGSVAAE